ncbi:hypothetical protein ACEPPN_002247 [Leptodophora sp. 'Broadleaf-Isolate-01']
MASKSVAYRSASAGSTEDPRLVRLQQLLSVFETDTVPGLLFSRAVQWKSSWGSNGELQTTPCEDIVPAWLITTIQDIGLFSRAIQSTPAASTSVYNKPLDQYNIPSEWRQKHREGISLPSLETLLFDVLSTTIQALPDAYTEILWEETEAELWDIILSTCVPFLAVIDISDIRRYMSLEPQSRSQNSTFWISLASFVIRICEVLKEHSPPSLRRLLLDIQDLLQAEHTAVANRNSASLQLSISIISMTVWNRLEDGECLEKLQELRSTLQDQKSNAILSFAMANYIQDLPEGRELSPLRALGGIKFTSLETLASAKLNGAKFVIDATKAYWGKLPLAVKTLVGYQAVHDKAFEVGQNVLEGCIDETRKVFGKTSVETLITGTQLMICYNSLALEAKAVVLADSLAGCICARKSEGQSNSPGAPAIDGFSPIQSMRGENLAVIIADSLIGLANYDQAKMILVFIWKYTKPTKTVALMCLVRLLKVNRRQRKERYNHDCLIYLSSAVGLLRAAPGELVFQCFEEVVCNLGAIENQEATSLTAWKGALEELLLFDFSELRISNPMMASIGTYHQEILDRRKLLDVKLQDGESRDDVADGQWIIEADDNLFDFVTEESSHHLVALTSLVLDILRSGVLSRPSSISAKKDRVKLPHQISSVGNIEAFQERRLVIAIDYGTTHTGVAIATPVGSVADLEEINIIQDWGSSMCNNHKIPSVISYSAARTKEHERQWGSDLSPQAIAMLHTKLQLEVYHTTAELGFISNALDLLGNINFQYIKDSGNAPNYLDKEPEQIIQDYLTKVVEHLFQDVRYFTPALIALMPVDIVATVPAEWDYRAKNSIFRALTKAGLSRENFPLLDEMILVSEPEAAAIYTARYLKEVNGQYLLRVMFT